MHSSFPAQRRNSTISIALDFGTDGLAVAYAIHGDVYIQNKWPSFTKQITIKPKCIALFDANENLISFGMDAKHKYINLSLALQKTWMLFERFKMALYAPPELKRSRSYTSSKLRGEMKKPIKHQLTASNGLTMSSKKVFVAVFRYIHNNCTQWLRSKAKIESDYDIKWIITVPAIWNDEAKNCMKTWAKAAGLIKNRIVYEPDCASLSIQHFINKSPTRVHYDVQSVKSRQLKCRNRSKLKFERGDKYILIDAGAGTVDVAAHEILGKFGVKEILPPSGNTCGSMRIDEKFNDLLNKIFGKQHMTQFKAEEPTTYMELMTSFTAAKQTCFKRESAEYHNVELPLQFMEHMKAKYGRTIGKRVKKTFAKTDLRKVYLEDEYLKMNVGLWQYMFDEIQDTQLRHIKKLLHESAMRNCKYLCMVGGLSCSPYFQRKMEEHFGLDSRYKLHVIVPSQPMLCVVEGAACFGITKNYIKARRLSKTYGVRVNLSLPTALQQGIPHEHICKHLAFNKETKKCHVRNCFEIMAVKGEEVLTNDVKIRKSKRLNGKQEAIIKYILCSDLEDPKVMEDGFTLGEIKLEFGRKVKDMVIHTEFHFYDTMLKVFVYPKSKRHLRKEVQLSYAQT